MIALPLSAGAVQKTQASLSPAVAETDGTVEGAPTGITEEVLVAVEVPAELVAATENV